MSNIDLKKTYKSLYNPTAKAVVDVTVPPINYLMIDGQGDPNTSQQYMDSVAVLYALAYGVRAISKEQGIVYTVMPLEGLWWWDENQHRGFDLSAADKADFQWTLMIHQPDHITAQVVESAHEIARKKKKNPPFLDDVRMETYDEGQAAQIMYIGSYDDEGPTVKKIHDHIEASGYQLAKKHHEIYLSDPRKVDVKKLKTVIRQPYSMK